MIKDVRLQDVEDHRAKDTEEECNSYRAAGEEATRVMKAIKVGGGPFAFHCTGKPGSLSTWEHNLSFWEIVQRALQPGWIKKSFHITADEMRAFPNIFTF